jgi:DNA-binding LytR/AlgR family response regulator
MLHVVHLEDDGPLREILKAAFMAAEPNMNLLQFIDSDETIAYIDQHVNEVDLFVLDIRVPGEVDGIGVARHIRTLSTTVPIVFTSAYTPPTRSLLTELNSEWFPKPWHIMETTKKLFDLIKK